MESREHPWRDVPAGKKHFLDLILKSGPVRLAVECKRTQNDASWVFLTDAAASDERRARVFWVGRFSQGQGRTWWDFDVRPSCLQSEFCAIRGTGEDQLSLLERVGRHVVDAAEELGTLILGSAPHVANEIVVPVIVTNASLYACPVDPPKISLDESRLSDARFSKVPYIRFRKTLAQRFPENAAPKSVKEADADRKRTVFVINSEKLIQFLTKWELAEIDAWPGELLPRQQAL